jgi:cytochrome c6
VQKRIACLIGVAIVSCSLLAACDANEDKATKIVPSEEQEAVGEQSQPPSGAQESEPPREAETEPPGLPVGDPSAGSDVFASAGCGSCHTLEAAGSEGSAGPNLDEAQPEYEDAVEQVTEGGGGMPAFRDQLTEQQIQDVAAFVVENTKS